MNLIHKIRSILGICNHEWEKTGGVGLYYDLLTGNLEEQEELYCKKCDTYRN